jgi:S1-C subfamily serine protease
MNVRERCPAPLGVFLLAIVCTVQTDAQETQRPSVGSPTAHSQSTTTNAPTGWADVVTHTRPAVVVIETDKGLATGFVIKPDGIIVTNNHVVAGATSMAVKYPSGEVYRSVYLLSADPVNDLAFLKIEAVDLPTIPLGNSNDVQVGEEVLLVGSPEGLEQTVSSGLISGIRIEDGVRVLQTSAAASPGSSGGPLLNRRGEAVGVMSFKVVNGENLNFTIPINYVRGKLDTLTQSNPQAFGPLKTKAEKHRGVWVSGYGSGEFQNVFMGVLDFLSTSGVDIANNGIQKIASINETGYMPLSSLIEKLPKTGADSLLYVKVEQGELMLGGTYRVTVYFQCFDDTGRLLWEEKAPNVMANGSNPPMRSKRSGWKSKITPHIGKPGLLLKQPKAGSAPDPEK